MTRGALVRPNASADWDAAVRRFDFPEAWRISDAVLAARDPAGGDDPALPYHERWVWDGTALDGRAVTVRCYHGLGDTLHFARYLPQLVACAGSVTVEAQPELVRLLDAQGFGVAVVPFNPASPIPAPDAAVEIMELCHALRARPAGRPYLRAAPAGAPGIGVCWQGGNWDPARSVDPERLLPFLPRAVSLQPGPPRFGWTPCPAGDVLDTARQVAGLDLVVTIDTMVAHLAGALGRPVCLLLRHGADWRWGEGDRVAWYDTVRPFRQARDGCWDAALAGVSQVVEALHQRVPVT